jgi:hypothetical protein
MFVRVFSLILACACAAPVVAAERPAPVTRPGVVTRDLPAVTPGIVRPGTAFRVAPSDLPRANIVRPENLRPLPTDARPIMPMLPGGPGVRPIVPRPDTGAVRPSPPHETDRHAAPFAGADRAPGASGELRVFKVGDCPVYRSPHSGQDHSMFAGRMG